jgi:hypothetical protein
MKSLVWIVACLGPVLCLSAYPEGSQHQRADQNTSAPKIRTYYLCAEEIDWDYTPDGKDMMMAMDFAGYSKAFTEHSEKRIGHTYRKAVFFEYTDGTFTTKKQCPQELGHTWGCSDR